MHWLVVVLLLLFVPAPAWTQTVQVTTGEHDGFTRIVLTRPGAGAWRLGRTDDGYELRVMGAAGFDVSRAFDRINRKRLASLSTGHAGILRLVVACACHAIPFEYRPDILVIDLRDGPPPQGSAFETNPKLEPMPPLSGVTAAQPDTRKERRFDWLALAAGTGNAIQPPDRSGQDLPVPVDLASLREALLMQFSRAAGQGLIDPALPMPDVRQVDPARPASPSANLRIGDGLSARTTLDGSPGLSPDGPDCPAPDRLAIESWGDGRPAALQMAAATVGIGEFDQAAPDAVARAARLYLHFGFGAETLALLSAFPADHPDADLWRSMARSLDGQPDPQGAFAAFAVCDGPAALWSVLSMPGDLPAGLNTDAVVRSFSALPADLRRHLGPQLAERFLGGGDPGTATAILDVVLRLAGDPDARTAVTMARIGMLYGEDEKAGLSLQGVLSGSGPAQVPALVALVDMHAESGAPLDPETVPAIAAHLAEAAATPQEPVLRRALTLAQALAGDFDAAFADGATEAGTLATLWDLLAAGPDSALIMHSIGADPVNASAETRRAIAGRLKGLGFLTEADRWAPAQAEADGGLPDDGFRAALRERDWTSLPAGSPDHWLAVADDLAPSPPAQLSPLAESRRIIDGSTGTQDAIRALLDAVPPP